MKWHRLGDTYTADLLDTHARPMISARITPFGKETWRLHIIYSGWWEPNEKYNNTYHRTAEIAKGAFENYAKNTMLYMLEQLGKVRPCEVEI